MATNTFKNAKARLSGAAGVSILTAPSGANQFVLIGCTIANRTALPVKVKLWITSADAGNTYVVDGASVPVGTSLVAIGGDQKIALMPSDVVKVASDTASSIDTILSYLEVAP